MGNVDGLGQSRGRQRLVAVISGVGGEYRARVNTGDRQPQARIPSRDPAVGATGELSRANKQPHRRLISSKTPDWYPRRAC